MTLIPVLGLVFSMMQSAPLDACPTFLPKDALWNSCRGGGGRRKGEWGQEDFSKIGTEITFLYQGITLIVLFFWH